MRPELYPPGARALQEQFDTTRLADRLEARTAFDELEEWHVKTIERASFFFLGTVDVVAGWTSTSSVVLSRGNCVRGLVVDERGDFAGLLGLLAEHRVPPPVIDPLPSAKSGNQPRVSLSHTATGVIAGAKTRSPHRP